MEPGAQRFMYYGSQQTQAPDKSQYRLPGPPSSPKGKAINTIVGGLALGYICLAGYWGSPIFGWGCVGMVARLLLEVEQNFRP